MSGICGQVGVYDRSDAGQVLGWMMDAAAHRGRDSRGAHIGRRWAIGNLQLDVTREDARHPQPYVSVDGTLVLTASARIDNREDLISLLRPHGMLRTPVPGDAELIAAAYSRWGVECASRLIGDFAFAVWDDRAGELFAARDPMGFRALYYRQEGERFLFSSEVAQILAVPGISPDIFEPAMAMHLAGSNPPQEWSFFEGIAQLPAGWAMQYDGRRLRKWRFWDPDATTEIRYHDHADYATHLRELLKDAVRARLRSRRPVGIWLSGGLDSGSVAATAGWLRQQNANLPPIHAYSWTYDELPQCDERHISDGIVQHYGLRAGYLPAESAAPLNGSSPVVTHPDEPAVQFYSPLLELALRQARADGVGLVMTGFRGDPMTASGEFDYLDLLVRGGWARIAKDFAKYRRRVPDWPVGEIVRNTFLRPGGKMAMAAPGIASLFAVLRAGPGGRTAFDPPIPLPPWMQPDLAARLRLTRGPRSAAASRPPLSGLARGDRYRSIFLPLFFRAAVEQERHNATRGIGYSDPWSDRRIAEYVLSIPANALSRLGDEKRITRQAMKGVMPEEVRRSARKIVPTPLYQRVLRHDGREAIIELFSGSRLAARGFIDESRMQRGYTRFLDGGPEDPCLWRAITAELWLRRHWN
jgi:asparagine synthase (glutamine-hydrolysing)